MEVREESWGEKKEWKMVGVAGEDKTWKVTAMTWRITIMSQMGATQFEFSLPTFLQSWKSPLQTQATGPVPVHAAYSHQAPFGQAQVLWWPCTSQDTSLVPRTILLFVPGQCTLLSRLLVLLTCYFAGNPGLLDFYIPFLDAIYHEANSSVTIFAHGHLGLSSYFGGDRSFPDTSSVGLPAQIQAHVELLDELLAAYGPETRVLLVGHSIGAWFIQEMLKARAAELRSQTRRFGAFLLCPTISEIARSPKGQKLTVRTSTAVIHVL